MRTRGDRLHAPSLIVAFCTNMAPQRALIFCRSIRQVFNRRQAEIVLVTDQPEALHRQLAPLEVSYHLTSCDFRPTTRKSEKLLKRIVLHACRLYAATPLDNALSGGAAGRLRYALAEATCHPLTARWFAYRRVLLERPAAQRVLLSDVKDVVLQEDCFAGLDLSKAYVVEQSEPYGQCYWDTLWLREGFGRRAVAALRGTLPVNGGTVLGGYAPVLGFVERATGWFLRHPFRIVDQTVINWMLYLEGDREALQRMPNITQQVATIAGNEARGALEARDGRIVRASDGAAVPIAHMWDRWQDLHEAVLGRYLGHQGQPLTHESPPHSIYDSDARQRAVDSAARPDTPPEPADLRRTLGAR